MCETLPDPDIRQRVMLGAIAIIVVFHVLFVNKTSQRLVERARARP